MRVGLPLGLAILIAFVSYSSFAAELSEAKAIQKQIFELNQIITGAAVKEMRDKQTDVQVRYLTKVWDIFTSIWSSTNSTLTEDEKSALTSDLESRIRELAHYQFTDSFFSLSLKT